MLYFKLWELEIFSLIFLLQNTTITTQNRFLNLSFTIFFRELPMHIILCDNEHILLSTPLKCFLFYGFYIINYI